MNIENFLFDGANVQAQIVAILLRDRYEHILDVSWDKKGFYRGMISIGRFENCREQGYVVSLRFDGHQRNYAFYEHRNTDCICVIVKDFVTINTPTKAEMICDMEDKWDVTKTFEYGKWQECVEFIDEDMREVLSKWVEEYNKLEEK